VTRLRRALLAWYDANRRDLPWRRTRDPYAIWISETMLQQTRVETVIPYYERFLARLPDVRALAAADSDVVLGLWAGLGYYSRARNLKRAARQLQDEHAGRLPDDPAALRRLPGVGRYTAGALASIAFDRPEPVLDGNVARVLVRVLGIEEDPRAPAIRRRLWEEAARLARGPRPGDLNQALMELGARVCLPRAPRCAACPLARRCAARAAGNAEELPRAARRAAPRTVRTVATWVARRGRVLVVRRPPQGLYGGLWELPGGDLARGELPATGARRTLREAAGLDAERLVPLGVVRHQLTHRVLRQHVFRSEQAVGRVRLDRYDAHRWLSPRALADVPVSRATRRALTLALEDGARP
jgi:A/G-specific adenine glycosylase